MQNRTLIILLAGLGLAVALLLVGDPFDLFGGRVERSDDDVELAPLDGEGGPLLEGRSNLVRREKRWIGQDPIGTLRLQLGAASLQGVVTGEDRPLESALVQLALEPRSLRAAVRTRPDGTWSITGLPAGTFEMRVSCEGWQARTVTTPAPEVDLERARDVTNEIRVRVTDEFGHPIGGAKVFATTMLWAHYAYGGAAMFGIDDSIDVNATTDEQGEATLRNLPPEKYDLAVVASGFQVAAQPSLVVALGTSRTITFRLEPGVSISGTVVGPDGNPLGGGWAGGMNAATFTMVPPSLVQADGSFVLDGLKPGSYWVFLGHDDHGELQATGIKAPSGGHRFKLEGAGKIDLRVVRADGAPVTEYVVRPFRAEPFNYTYSMRLSVKNEEGRHEWAIGPGTYNLAIKSVEGDHVADATAAVKIGEVTKVEVTLPSSRSVSGVVVDPDGNHVAGAEVYVKRGGFPTEPDRELYARTDTGGHFEVLGLDEGVVRLHAEHPEFAPTVVELEPSPAGQGKECTIRLSAGAVVEGRLSRGTEPIAGEIVSLMPGFQFFDARTTRTDDAGRYRFIGVAPGTYTISAGQFQARGGIASQRDVKVGEDGTVTVDLDAGPSEGAGVLEGVVRHAGVPVAGARVTVVDGRGYDHAVTTTTGSQGGFRAEGLVAGSAQVYAEADGGLTKGVGASIPEDGVPGRVEVVFGGGVIRARIHMLDQKPVSGAWIQIERMAAEGGGTGNVRATVMSDVEGNFQAGGLEAGTYRVRISGGSHAGMLTDPFGVAEGQVVDLGTLRLEAGAPLQGRVTDDAGTPLEDVTIALEDETGRDLYLFSLVSTGSDGRYQATGLAPGRYLVKFHAKGYATAEVEVTLQAQGGTADAVLARGGAIEVTVEDPEGAVLPGAWVTLVDARGEPVRRTLSLVNLEDPSNGSTNDAGKVRLRDLAPGGYRVRATLGGHRLEGDAPFVQVSSAGTISTRIVLRPE